MWLLKTKKVYLNKNFFCLIKGAQVFCFAVSPSGLFKAFQSRLPRPKRVLLPSLEPKLESEFSGAQNTQDFCHPNLTCDRGMDLMFTPIAN